MSEAKFGNVWHGQLSGTGVTPPGGTEITSINVANGTGGTTAVSYVSPGYMENLGHTYYYKQPGIAAVVTPAAVSAIGGKFENDAILFGSARRYSPFKGGGLLGERCWIHYGSDGKWRKMSLEVVSVGSGSAPVVRINRHEQFGLINKATPYEATVLGEVTLAGKVVSDPLMSEIDVRHDGRQIVICLSGKWTNSSDPAAAAMPSTQSVPFDNNGYRSIAAAWRMDIAADCSTASVTRVWLASDPDYTTSFDRTWWEPNGALYLEGGIYYQPVKGVNQANFDSIFVFERLIGAGFSADGTLQLLRYTYRSELVGQWGELEGHANQGYTPTPFVARASPAPVWKAGHPTVVINHATTCSYLISVLSGATSKTFSAPLDPPPHAVMKTNNASDFRQPSQSICRLAAGCIEDFTISGTGEFVFVAFNPRAGTVHSSSSPIGFV